MGLVFQGPVRFSTLSKIGRTGLGSGLTQKRQKDRTGPDLQTLVVVHFEENSEFPTIFSTFRT
jgi:hypothetical protein